jgi:hypothetical protein
VTRPAAPAAAIGLVRQLPPVAGLQELWQQRVAEGESDAEYHDFLDWLDRGATRGAPPDRCASVATRHEWAERALAYERQWELARADAAGTPEHQVVSNLTRMVQLETAKLLRQSASTTAPVVAIKDIIATVGLIKDLQVAGIAAASAKADLSGLTQDEKKQILAAQLLLRKATKK